jgi:uncharacterized metal-binding protein
VLYEDQQTAQLHRGASAVEARYYCRGPRLGEVILFAEELGFRKVGLAFCIGLASEARAIEEILARHFDVSVCCKVGGIAVMKSCHTTRSWLASTLNNAIPTNALTNVTIL